MLKVEHITMRFGKKTIIKDISMELEEGIHGLLGPNGAGKTTFIRSVAGLYPKSKGSVYFNGEKLEGSHIGYLPQKFGLFPNMTVRQLMHYLGTMKKLPRAAIEKELEQLLDELHLTEHADCKGAKLSGGMIRRVGIMQAFLGNPGVVLLDEPTAGLDPEERLRFKNFMKERKRNGQTILVSTHIVDDIDYIGDYVEVMQEGQIKKKGTCDEIISCAAGKVYEMERETYERQISPGILVKEYEKEGMGKVRVLLPDGAEEQELTPTLEDGYLCILKGW